MSEPAQELVDQKEHVSDGWPFTIATFKTPEGYRVQSYLRNMPVSHAYMLDNQLYEIGLTAGEDRLEKLHSLARQDLDAGSYRAWILHWASQ